MKKLISIQQKEITGQQIKTVNARELHVFLEVGKVFGAWIQERIDQFGFTEGHDFVVVSESGKNPLGGRPSKEYALTLDMAKELSMVERSAKGKQARQYFIECERTMIEGLKAIKQVPLAKVATDMQAILTLADGMGLKGNAARITANTAIIKLHGIDLLDLLGIDIAAEKPPLSDWFRDNREITSGQLAVLENIGKRRAQEKLAKMVDEGWLVMSRTKGRKKFYAQAICR